MHLLATQSGVVGEGNEAVDLKQDPADIIILSCADTELACLARAHDRLPAPKATLRLANLLQLQHPLSVDLFAERTLSASKLIIIRLLGGKSYWSYGIDVVESLARERRIALAVLPGDRLPDPGLARHNTMAAPIAERLRLYLAEGGLENAASALCLAQAQIGFSTAPAPLKSLANYGVYRAAEGKSPGVVIIFYRALVESGFTAPIDALADALDDLGVAPLCLFVSSLKDRDCAAFIERTLAASPPSVIVNTTGFALAMGQSGENPFRNCDCPVLQAVLAGSGEAQWRQGSQGLSPRDLAMNVVLPEIDGRIMTRALSFKADSLWHATTQCRIVTYDPVPNRVRFTAALAANWTCLRLTPPGERRVALLLANYPNRDGRIGNGVGYDTPASTINILRALEAAGYRIASVPSSGNALIEALRVARESGASTAALRLGDYQKHFRELPARIQADVTERWGLPQNDPVYDEGSFRLAVCIFGHVAVAIQPSRGYDVDPKSTYHDPALVPPHGYFALYFWLCENFGAQAVIHNGKHGNLEWLPGKAVALSEECYPEAVFGPLPQLYPFIVNDPGEGTQAKRRTSAVIIDHLTPPLTRAESYGPLRDLESLIDEYYLAVGVDRRRLLSLRRRIFDTARAAHVDLDAGLGDEESDGALQKLDAWLCDLKEAQIRDGLHILGETPAGRNETDFLAALVRTPRGLGEGADQSVIRALASDLKLLEFDPLSCNLAEPWFGARPHILACLLDEPWRTNGDTIERLECLAARLIDGSHSCATDWNATRAVMTAIDSAIRPSLRSCGSKEIAGLLQGLDGRFVEPGPSGAPTRGRLDVLPTGRNFFSLDNRAVPTPTAWSLGQRSAEAMLQRHFQDHGTYPRALGLSVWGTSNMRTGGDDIAQALALIGARPRWDKTNWRVTGYEIIPLPELGRPRVDVTLRISGFFRDAFPLQIELFDRAVRAVACLEESGEDNPMALRTRTEAAELCSHGATAGEAERVAGQRIFGSKPGAYGAGLQAVIDEKLWADRADLARAYVVWGSYAYGAGDAGEWSEESFLRRLRHIEVVAHNQDNREHDLLDSDDYYQFEGGMTAAVEQASGRRPLVYHNDHSRPERPLIRTLEEEISRVMRSRVVNPKWIAGIMRHGYKGAFEIAATVDYLFAFSATTGASKSHHFDLAYDAFLADREVRNFIAENNPSALREIAERFAEAAARGLWAPRSNSAYDEISRLTGG
jgi:cobaltochelatase CobN